MGADDGRKQVVVVVGDDLPADLALVDALARLQLAARRFGCSIRVHGTGDDLGALLELVGLAEVLPATRDCSGLELGGKAEGLEELRVEEVVEPGDASL